MGSIRLRLVMVCAAFAASGPPGDFLIRAADEGAPLAAAVGGPDVMSRHVPVAEQLRVAAGFCVELVYAVPRETQGSWVSLAVAPDGRLVASDQQRGLYRITLPGPGDARREPQVERLAVEIGGAQGLLFAHDSLYAVVNGSESGLYRLRDADGDDRFEQVELLRRFDGAGEHGPHAVVLAPDGESLYLVGGNDCFPREFPESSRVPQVWQEDRLLSRTSASDGPWGDRRHGGWICRTDRGGQRLELVAMGLRNPYDIAFNADGELFTFDADMEWDFGTPWYRPTRVCHVISGADFGWRAGTAKWPDGYFDSFGAVVDVGLSSPTGIAFGDRAAFPAKYRRALFLGDWSWGNIYAMHLEPAGGTYRGEIAPFVAGAPLPVTDLVIRPQDGALYFVVGGRGVHSALYRVRYMGATESAEATEDNAAGAGEAHGELRSRRRRLEDFHRPGQSIETAALWPSLASGDRAVRYAARTALEHLPLERWRNEAAAEGEPRARIAGLLAAVRHAPNGDVAWLLDALASVSRDDLPPGDRADLLRTYVVLLSRQGREGDAGKDVRRRVCEQVDRLFPAQDETLDALLAEILVFAQAPRIVDRVLERLERAETQEAQIHYAMCLRDVRDGWTLPQLRRLFAWFQQTTLQRGGVLFGDYLEDIRSALEKRLTADQRDQLLDVLTTPQPAAPLAVLAARAVVREWTVDELLAGVEAAAGAGDPDRGRAVYKTALCLNCHRLGGQGGRVGPDLTGVLRRFSVRDVVEAVVDPDRVISDQYRGVRIVTDQGTIVTGKIADLHGVTLTLIGDLLDPGRQTKINRDQIDELTWSPTSTMPRGLLDTFTARDAADLLAHLRAAAPPRE